MCAGFKEMCGSQKWQVEGCYSGLVDNFIKAKMQETAGAQ